MRHNQVEVARARRHVGEREAVRWRVDELAPRDQRRRLGEPGRIPEGSDLAPHLVARSRAAVEAIVRRSLQEKGTHHALGSTTGTKGARATGGAGLATKYAQLVAAGQGGRPWRPGRGQRA